MFIKISKDFNAKIKRLVKNRIFESEQQAIEVACALGLIYNEKNRVEQEVALELENFDDAIFSIIATARNKRLRTKEDVVAELEKYIEAGSLRINEKFDFYESYKLAKELEPEIF